MLAGGGWGGARRPQSLHPSWGVQAGPQGGRDTFGLSGTRGVGISLVAPRGVLGRRRWGAPRAPMGAQPCWVRLARHGITGDVPTARRGAAGGAEPQRGTVMGGQRCPVPNPCGFWVPKHLWGLWMPRTGRGRSLSSASLRCPAGHPEAAAPSGRGRGSPGCASCRVGTHRVPAGIPGPGSRPGGQLGSPSVTSALGRHPPRPRRPVPAWPGPNALRRPPRPGTSQVLERSWERIPWPRCGSAHAPGDPRASPCQGLISWLTRRCFRSALILPSPASGQL